MGFSRRVANEKDPIARAPPDAGSDWPGRQAGAFKARICQDFPATHAILPNVLQHGFRCRGRPVLVLPVGMTVVTLVTSNRFGGSLPDTARITVVPALTGHIDQAGNGFKLIVTSQTGRAHRLQASTNLINWTDLFAFTTTDPVTSFLDVEASNFVLRFYRVVSP